MNSEDIEVWGPAGQYVKGNEAHIEFLKEWVAATNVKWTPQWFINNTGENTETGQVNNYVTSGHQMTFTIDGEETIFYQVHDAVISDGKVIIGSQIGGGLTSVGNREGISFFTGSFDKKIYAINNNNGDYLWSHQLPETGSALPLIYNNSSERWIFVVAGGRRSTGYRGNNIVAFKQKLN